MSVLFCSIFLIFLMLVEHIKKDYNNSKREILNITHSIENEELTYYDKNYNLCFLKTKEKIIIKRNQYGDICFYNYQTGKEVFNHSEYRRKEANKKALREAKAKHKLTVKIPYVYKRIENNKISFFSETIELKTFQPFQLRYIPKQGFGFVIRKAPAIIINKYYDYDNKNDLLKWGAWHIISKEQYSELSGKPFYEYITLNDFNPNEIIRN